MGTIKNKESITGMGGVKTFFAKVISESMKQITTEDIKNLIKEKGSKIQGNPLLERVIRMNTGKSISQWMKEIENEKED